MTDEPNNPDSGTEGVDAQTPDTTEDWNYYDPDEEDQDTEQGSEEAVIEDGADETTAEEAEVVEAAEASADAVVTLHDGKKAKVSDLIAGNMRQDDYTRKTQETATERKAVRADAERIERITQSFIDHLSAMVPAAPDHALALRDPNGYIRQKAQHEAALAQVQKLIEIGDQPKQVSDAMTAHERDAMIADENRRLADRFPAVATEQGRQKFFAQAAEAAQEIGFSMDDLKGVTDHRMFVLAHYAKVGMEAMKAREVAKTKAQAAPPVAPRKPGQQGQATGNADAMRRFNRNPTPRNAAAAWSGD